jgi:hypothetical protein
MMLPMKTDVAGIRALTTITSQKRGPTEKIDTRFFRHRPDSPGI